MNGASFLPDARMILCRSRSEKLPPMYVRCAAFKQSAVTQCLAPRLAGENRVRVRGFVFLRPNSLAGPAVSVFAPRSEDVEEFAVEFDLDVYTDELSEGEKTQSISLVLWNVVLTQPSFSLH